MANEIHVNYASGNTLYAVVRRRLARCGTDFRILGDGRPHGGRLRYQPHGQKRKLLHRQLRYKHSRRPIFRAGLSTGRSEPRRR
jgi:hypothetical protein